jgi:excisionase family DNA binding protein
MSDVMNLKQLAAYIQMSEAQVYHLVASGKIPGVKAGKQWRFARVAIDQWLHSANGHAGDVLIVEDDAAVRNLISDALRDAGHRPVAVDTVAAARAVLKDIRFDVAILDLMLPDGNGYDIVQVLFSEPIVPEIIVITAHPEHELIDQIRAMLPDLTVLSKPFRLQTLVSIATKALTGKAPPRERG